MIETDVLEEKVIPVNEQVGAPPENPIGRFVHNIAYQATGSIFFWIVLIAILSSYPFIRGMVSPVQLKMPEIYGQIPEFTFTDEVGKPFGSKQLLGKVWVANFMFTTCASICPAMTQKMIEIRHRTRNLKWMMHIVSFSVDPVRDTPERLNEYAKEHLKGFYDGKTWKFLTGPLETIDKVVIDGFKIAVERKNEEDPTLFEITHGEKMVLVDKSGRIRGYYNADEEGIKKLLLDISIVANTF